MLDVRDARADGIHGVEIIGSGAHHAGSAVVDDVSEIFRSQADIDRHKNSANLRHRIIRFQVRMIVRRDVCDAVSLTYSKRRERGRPAIAAVEKLRIRQTEAATDNRFPAGVESPRTAGKLKRCERYFHGWQDILPDSVITADLSAQPGCRGTAASRFPNPRRQLAYPCGLRPHGRSKNDTDCLPPADPA